MAERTRKITKAVVDALQPGAIAWDADVKGFGVRCQRRDRVYLVKYRAHGRQRWYTIGKHGSPWTAELARREAKRILGLRKARTRPTSNARTGPPRPSACWPISSWPSTSRSSRRTAPPLSTGA